MDHQQDIYWLIINRTSTEGSSADQVLETINKILTEGILTWHWLNHQHFRIIVYKFYGISWRWWLLGNLLFEYHCKDILCMTWTWQILADNFYFLWCYTQKNWQQRFVFKSIYMYTKMYACKVHNMCLQDYTSLHEPLCSNLIPVLVFFYRFTCIIPP